MMTNREWCEELKRQGIYAVITDPTLSVEQMAELLAKGRDVGRVQYKIRTILSCLKTREANPDGIVL